MGKGKKIVLALLALIVICVGGVYYYLHQPQNSAGMDGLNSTNENFEGARNPNSKESSQNADGITNGENSGSQDGTNSGLNMEQENKIQRILLLGVDKRGEENLKDSNKGMRTDTIMLFSIDKKNDKVQLLSIPRDSYVNIHGFGKNKINAAYNKFAYKGGGVNLTAQTVEDILNVKVDNYAVVDFIAVEKLVDAVGGVSIVWDHPAYSFSRKYNVDEKNADLVPGINNLDGKKTLNYLRIRKGYENSDLGRISTQQYFLVQMLDSFKKPSMILKAPELLGIINENVVTDFTNGEILELVTYSSGLKKGNVENITLEGNVTNTPIGGINASIVDLDLQKAKETVYR